MATNAVFEKLTSEIIACHEGQIKGINDVNALKKRLGKVISAKARELKVNEDDVKNMKALLFDKINVQVWFMQKRFNEDHGEQKRKLKVGKNR